MPMLELDDVTLHYDLQGAGDQTIVLVNGLGDDLTTWAFQTDDFVSAGYQVLTVDNRGIGRSSAPAGPYTSAQLAADTKQVVDHLGLTGIHLMGVSMGGMVVQEYALAYPEDVATLVPACTFAAPNLFCSRMFALWSDLAPVVGVPTVLRDVLLWAFTQEFFEMRADELAEFETAMRYTSQTVPAYLAQLAVIQNHDTTDRLRDLDVPTMVLAGEQDILIPVSLSRRLCDLIPGATWATTPGGHGCMWEYPAEFNRVYLDFLASRSGGDGL